MNRPSIPGYKNLTLIGKGGFSRVYRADQAKFQRKVAVKVLNFGLNDDEDRRSFQRETQLMGRVSTHPNIVTVHDTAFTAAGQPCIVMEHYPGGSLADLIGEVGRLEVAEVLEVGVAIASALEASHQTGVLHCDLKPQNILISEFGQPALGDFGISTFAEERTRTGKESGAGFTLPYAAPEIIEGESPTVSTDVYSLAATLYTSLIGRRPFADPNDDVKPTAAEQARRILLEDLPSLVDEGVPPEVDAVIRSAMMKDPAMRPTSAAEFATALYRVGRQLGLGTSAPRTSGGGARQGVGPGHESDVAQSSETPMLVAAVGEAIPASRRLAAIGIGVAALLVVVGVFLVVRRADGDGAATTQDEPISAGSTGPVVDPVVAPSRPSGVELSRVEDHAVAVRFSAPVDDLESGDVSFEIRRQGNGPWLPLVTTVPEATLVGVADDEAVCVSVLAVRANRASSPTEPACSPSSRIAAGLAPNECPAATGCQVQLVIDGAGPGSVFDVEVLDRSLNNTTDRGFVYPPPLTVAGDGASDWRLSLPADVPVGGYLVAVTDESGRTETALLSVRAE